MVMQVTLVDYTQDAEAKIATYSAVCYGADTSPDANARRIRKLLDLNHLATLRFANATFFIDGISRTCSHQIVRSSHLEFLQESQRYVKQHGIEYVVPESLEGDPDYQRLMATSYWTYTKLLGKGVRKEDARFALLEAAPTKLYVTGNFQAWHDFLRNRTDKHAQWEIREVAVQVGKQLANIAPNVFKEYA